MVINSTKKYFNNKMKRTILALAISATLLCPIASLATEVSSNEIVTLQEVLENITKTDPTILEAQKNYKSVLAERDIATSEYYPSIGTEISAGPERTDGVATDDIEENLTATTATLYARQNLYNGGKTTAFVDETDARIYAAAFEVLNVANRVYLNTAEAYINVVKATELLRIAEENALTQERIMRQVREKTEAGFNRVSELYNSESRLALSKGSYVSRQQDLNQAIVIFHRQFGRLLDPGQFIKPKPNYKFPETLPETVDRAFKTHPALKVAKYNIQTSRYSYEKSTAAYYPTLDLELKGQYSNDTGGEEGETTQSGAYLTLNYTFFDGGLRGGVKAREQQSLRKEIQRAYIERRNVNESVRLAWNIMEAENYKKEYLTEHVVLSLKTLDAFKEEYYVGRRTLLDLLNMENEFTDAQMSIAESQYSHLVSLYRILQATGELLDEHDTGLRETLNLPLEKEDDMKEYKELEENRDEDLLKDMNDQCDNSIPNSSSIKPYGCDKEDVNTTGYPHEDDSTLSPYIAPEDFNSSPEKVVETNESDIEAEVSEQPSLSQTKIILEAKPNSDFITDEALSHLIEFTKTVSPGAKILIEGYIASDTDSIENTDLSKRRADIVKQFLLDHGVKEEQITVEGRGNKKPIADNRTAEGRKQNRRIELTVTGS